MFSFSRTSASSNSSGARDDDKHSEQPWWLSDFLPWAETPLVGVTGGEQRASDVMLNDEILDTLLLTLFTRGILRSASEEQEEVQVRWKVCRLCTKRDVRLCTKLAR
ncbi:MAG: hypothetical protein ACREOZ_04180 [Gloeomargaritales cyanobacterium]